MNHFCPRVAVLLILGLSICVFAQTTTPIVGPDPALRVISGDGSFRLVSGEIPTYPELALAAGIQGTVEVQVTVTLGAVTTAETSTTISGAQSLLATAAKKNVMSWKFPPDQSGTFKATFSSNSRKTKV